MHIPHIPDWRVQCSRILSVLYLTQKQLYGFPLDFAKQVCEVKEYQIW